MKKQNYKEQKGITLIALVITIIVMLILVTVSVTIILQSGIFKAASTAAQATNEAKNAEYTLSGGTVTIEGAGSQNIEDYVKNLTGTTIAGGMGPINPGIMTRGQSFSLEGINWVVLADNGDGTVTAAPSTGMGSLTLGGTTVAEARASWDTAQEDIVAECQRVIEQTLKSSDYTTVRSIQREDRI